MLLNKYPSTARKLDLYPDHVLESFGEDWSGFIEDDLEQVDDVYFNSYGCIGIHEEMLKDTARTGIYHKAIMNNQSLFKDKIVMDIGCGTGILSLFCAKAGAKKIYAIDNSNIIKLAEKIVHVNGMSDKVIFIKSRVEDIQDDIEHVDIIVSEWMGYFLLYENMLSTVLYCRDKWLKSDGLIFPDRARLFIAGFEDGKYKRYGSIMSNWTFDRPVRPHNTGFKVGTIELNKDPDNGSRLRHKVAMFLTGFIMLMPHLIAILCAPILLRDLIYNCIRDETVV